MDKLKKDTHKKKFYFYLIDFPFYTQNIFLFFQKIMSKNIVIIYLIFF